MARQIIDLAWALLTLSSQNINAIDEVATALVHEESCPGTERECALSLLQMHGKKQQVFEASSAFCCHASAISADKCGSCYPQAKAKSGSYCAKESTCAGCGGTWCKGQSSIKVNTTGLIMGISYGPSPKLDSGPLVMDDFFCDAAKEQWGPQGRGDLRIMKAMGANTVRLYGNNADLDHRDFLIYSSSIGLSVVPGISDAPYLAVSGACARTGTFDCFQTVKDAYLQNLQKGFLLKNKSYHPALTYVIAVNEPDLKLPNLEQPSSFAKAIATAIDGMLDAERVAGVTGSKPNITATFSFSQCNSCTKFAGHPALAQMWMLRDAMLHPAKYGFSPKNDLDYFYRTRFVNSFNTGNPSQEIRKLFLDLYEQEFPSTPVFIGEYHNPGNQNTESDLKNILAIAQASPLLMGVSFFEWQNRFDVAGHSIWGIFDPQQDPESMNLGASADPEKAIFGSTFEVDDLPCLVPAMEGGSKKTIPEMITAAYGGPGMNFNKLCQPDPATVQVNEHGFRQIQRLNSLSSMQTFIARLARHFGGDADAGDVPEGFAKHSMPAGTSFAWLKLNLEAHPAWARWSRNAACIVDTESTKSRIADALSYVCGQGRFDCGNIPANCKESLWETANYAFGAHFHAVARLLGEVPDPDQECAFGGAARLASQKDQKVRLAARGNALSCTVSVDVLTPEIDKVQIDEQSFFRIAMEQADARMSIFISRVVLHMGGALRHLHSPLQGMPQDFVQKYIQMGIQNSTTGFENLARDIGSRPSWTVWTSSAACLARPDNAEQWFMKGVGKPELKISDSRVGQIVGYICGAGTVDCRNIPQECQSSMFKKATYVFGSHFKILQKRTGKLPNPLKNCFFHGDAILTSSAIIEKVRAQTNISEACIVPVDI